MNEKTLFCTVGGSHQPIVASIKYHAPTHVVFVCSNDDPLTENSGSYTTISGKGKVCSSKPGAGNDLPNIPTQAGLEAGSYEELRIPADDPAQAMKKIMSRMTHAQKVGAVIADYTGGTKSMSCALFYAALMGKDVELAFVGGPRNNLRQIVDGTHTAQLRDTTALKLTWLLEEASRAWKRHAYAEAEKLLEGIGSNNKDVQHALLLSRAFGAWDRFDHESAYQILAIYRGDFDSMMRPLARLKARKNCNSREAEALAIWDIWLNSQRRQVGGHYDTAILMLYRGLEWIAQWTLRHDHDIDTSNAPEHLPKGLAHPGRDGRLKLGMEASWRAIASLDGPLSELAVITLHKRNDVANVRNSSICAHGDTPVGASDYADCRDWFEKTILPAFVEVAFEGKAPFQQLPVSMSASQSA